LLADCSAQAEPALKVIQKLLLLSLQGMRLAAAPELTAKDVKFYAKSATNCLTDFPFSFWVDWIFLCGLSSVFSYTEIKQKFKFNLIDS